MSVLTMQQTPYEKIGFLTDGADLRNTSFLLCPFKALGFILSSFSLVSCEYSGQWWEWDGERNCWLVPVLLVGHWGWKRQMKWILLIWATLHEHTGTQTQSCSLVFRFFYLKLHGVWLLANFRLEKIQSKSHCEFPWQRGWRFPNAVHQADVVSGISVLLCCC